MQRRAEILGLKFLQRCVGFPRVLETDYSNVIKNVMNSDINLSPISIFADQFREIAQGHQLQEYR